MMVNDATLAQWAAADPAQSVWLSANAGSGKTKVLTDRVARLLINGTEPQHILCLTFTKAAASEMQNRLFSLLGQWAMKPDDALRDSLVKLGLAGEATGERLRHARTLFARAIETPGGLKIQTIHSFCAGLLRRFPLESGVAPQFVEMDERMARLMQEDVLNALAEGPAARHIGALADAQGGVDLIKICGAIMKLSTEFTAMKDLDDIWARLGLPVGYTEEQCLNQVFLGGEADLFAKILPVIATGLKTDVAFANTFQGVDFTKPSLAILRMLERSLLFSKDAAQPFAAKIGKTPTKGTQARLGDLMGPLEDLMRRVESARPNRLKLENAQRTRALYQFAQAFVPAYNLAKSRKGFLDFDDLIQKAGALLARSDVAQWVLFRLDGGIDHILVDEAQDTNANQWLIVKHLAADFTSGMGARPDVQRSLFVVGDKKQSIYRFQGADPEAFSRMKQHFADQYDAIQRPLQDLSLDFSFRSSAAILQAVDATFAPAAQNGLDGLDGPSLHRAFAQKPGRVDLWPLLEPGEKPKQPAWYLPDAADYADTEHTQLATEIAAFMRDGLEHGSIIDKAGTKRPIRAGDFLILVRNRTGIFHDLIRACKSAGLPVAGADRLNLTAEIAVKDVLAVLRFLALRDDDLSLAEALRSPFFGFDEDALFRLAHQRTTARLWDALLAQDDKYPETCAVLLDLRRVTDFMRPYEIIERLLTRHGGRQALLNRLGREIEDGLDALLAQALAYERQDVPSLTGFLAWIGADAVEIKRQPDTASNQIRIMTIHGAKGLEAPIVILPDAMLSEKGHVPEFVQSGDLIMWRKSLAEQSDVMAQSDAERVEADQRETQRLLYVAMTRAENWLVICGSGKATGKVKDWHSQVESGLKSLGALPHDFATGMGLRLAHGDWPEGAARDALHPIHGETLATFATSRAAVLPRATAPLSPSQLGGAKITAAAAAAIAHVDDGQHGADWAMVRGTLIHKLLEVLPPLAPETRPAAAARMVAQFVANNPSLSSADAISASDQQTLIRDVLAILNAPGLAHIFGADALVEVPFHVHLPRFGVVLSGAIDRMLVDATRVLIVDYKSNHHVPETVGDMPDGITRQMAAYKEAMSQIYPDHQIECAVLWTQTQTLMPIPAQMMEQALNHEVLLLAQQTPHDLDVTPVRS